MSVLDVSESKTKPFCVDLLFSIAQESHWEELIIEEATSPLRADSIEQNKNNNCVLNGGGKRFHLQAFWEM